MFMSYIRQLRSNIVAEISRQDLTQTTVAMRMELQQNALSGRLHGRIPFRLPELLSLAEMLDVPLSHLLNDVEDAYLESGSVEGMAS